MAAEDLRRDIRALYDMADSGAGLASMMDGICAALARNADALEGITYSYRIHAGDIDLCYAFALENGRFAMLDSAAPADVTVTGTERNLLSVLQRKTPPLVALLRGKIKMQGSKAALVRLAEFL